MYYNGDARRISVSVCPAGHLPAVECPKEWTEDDGTPRQFPILFEDGSAIVEPPLGRYLVAQKIARSTKIILPGFSL